MAYKKISKKTGGEKIVCQNPDCDKMGKRLTQDDFYKSRNPSIPHHPWCKDCVNESIDLNNMETVYSVLQVLDTPFIMDEWNKVVESGNQNVIGAYLRIVNFTQKRKYQNLGYKDSVFTLSENVEPANPNIEQLSDVPVWNDEWQGRYSKSDIEYLNNYYRGLQEDFKIVTTNHRDYARKIAQASLAQSKAYQNLLDGKDGAEGAYEKATKIFDTLSKSAQFAESQRGANDVSLGSFGRVFDAVEKHNWIPTYVPDNEDMYDKLLKQFANIEKSL